MMRNSASDGKRTESAHSFKTDRHSSNFRVVWRYLRGAELPRGDRCRVSLFARTGLKYFHFIMKDFMHAARARASVAAVFFASCFWWLWSCFLPYLTQIDKLFSFAGGSSSEHFVEAGWQCCSLLVRARLHDSYDGYDFVY